MARNSKSVETIKGHRTKDELKSRREAENAALSNIPMKMHFKAKEFPRAAKEFRRIKKLMASVKKDDEIFSQSINRYCLLFDEIFSLSETKQKISADENALDEKYKNQQENTSDADKIDTVSYFLLKTKMEQNLQKIDKSIMSKRKMMFDIEKESGMTLQSALRIIPKKKEEKQVSGMAALLRSRQTSG